MSNVPEYSVSEISISIKNSLENEFNRVKIKGEISGLMKASSGHYYFNLKDEESTLSSIIWRSRASFLEILPEEGLEVIALGKISTYMPRSNYNFIIENVKIAGEGALLKLIEDRKKKLQEQGFFESNSKKKLPFIPKEIGIITSSTGAVIQDMTKRIKERFPSNILLWPVSVQGSKSEKEIESAIIGFNALDNKPDVIILARGGGSLEDLMSFNSEKIANAIFRSVIPIISAVGHETDFTIADLVADFRASTPTAAADIVVPERKDLIERVDHLSESKNNHLQNIINNKNYKLESLIVKVLEPKTYLSNLESIIENECDKIKFFFDNYFIRTESLMKNLNLVNQNKKIIEYNNSLTIQLNYFTQSVKKLIEKKSNLLESKIETLNSCSYERWLEKGFVVIKGLDGKLIKNINMIKKHKNIKIKFSDGSAEAKVLNYEKKH